MHADPQPERTRQFRAIYRSEFAFMWACARRLGVAPAVVDDAVQDVFLTAYRRLDHLRYEVSPRAWLYGVTRRVASHYRRGAHRRARKGEALRVAQPDNDPPQQRLDAARQLERLLAPLSPANREVFELVELLGMSGPEVAAELGQPLNTVYSRLRLARAQLQTAVAAADLDAAVAARKHLDAPPEDQSRRSWTLVLPLLGQASATTGIGATLFVRAAIATTLLVGAAVLAVPQPPGETPPAPLPTITPASSSPAPRPPPSSSPPQDDSLAREVALLDQARARLAAPADALALLATHAEQFPRGALVDAREAMRAEALCRHGEPAAAAAVVRELRRTHPDSAVARRLENFSCPR
ncbi:MAG: sigma-70 family RNA polymerase sigma factor [Myxococcales bacterium]|nr:sigma-70 family RNA polymerase sigma factor [Myxococcales bacterium]